MSRDINPFGLRMPQQLRDQLEQAASAKGRSLNSEILQRLQRSFIGFLGGTPEQDEAHVDALVQGFVYKSDEPNEQLAAREIALVAALTEKLSIAAASLKHTIESGHAQRKTQKPKKRSSRR